MTADPFLAVVAGAGCLYLSVMPNFHQVVAGPVYIGTVNTLLEGQVSSAPSLDVFFAPGVLVPSAIF